MPRRGGKRLKQTLYITEQTRHTLDQFSALHGLNLSEAAESLMLLGLQDTKSIGQAELIAATVRYEMTRQYNRFAKLSATAAIEAGAAKEMVLSVYWYLLLSEYANYEETLTEGELPSFSEFEAMFRIESDSAPGKIIGTMMRKRSEIARYKSVKSLRNSFEMLHQLMQEMDEWEATQDEPKTTQTDDAASQTESTG